MNAKDEFYQLISASFTQEEVATIQGLIANLEKEQLMKDDAAYYYDLCSLYYTVRKNFRNFVANLDNRRQSADRLKYFEQEDNEEKEKNESYKSIYNIFEDWLAVEPFINTFRNHKKREACATALTNAVYSELKGVEDIGSQIQLFENYKKIKELIESLESGGKITKFKIWSGKKSSEINHEALCSNLWKSFVSYTNRVIISYSNLDGKIQDFVDKGKRIHKRIILRICKVLVRFNVLTKTTESQRPILKNEYDKYVQLSTDVMAAIYDVLIALENPWVIKREKSKPRDEKTTLREKADAIINQLRSHEKIKGEEPVNPVEDIFDYKDIREDFYGALLNTTCQNNINDNGINRFYNAQEHFFYGYKLALSEIRKGRKRGRWIWYIFPQMIGLGTGSMFQYYGIVSIDEAQKYMNDSILSSRFREITNALLSHKDKASVEIFGKMDSSIVKSCMTLFDIVCPNDIFAEVINQFYNGERCTKTLSLLGE